ncbi:MAG TPA: TonB-dependent receptor [Opitutaceae bacterium]|nr:TonB-dependent receptor [Opitutaceae bacterium]
MTASPQSNRFRGALWRLSGIIASSLVLPLAASAQTAPAASPDQASNQTAPAVKPNTASPDQVVKMNPFVVAGSYAGSLEMAAQEKQNSPAIVEVIVPEDIGKLPDISIADALTRLPGLTSQRVNGRDQQITIRGFDPNLSVGTLDGVEQANTNDNRAVEYDQYPAELVGGVKVIKSGSADVVGGLAGTIDLETTSPLAVDYSGFALSAYYNWPKLGELTPGNKTKGESYSGTYIGQFAGGTEGVFLGFSHTENPYEGQQFQAWGYPTDANGNYVLGGMKIYAQNNLLKRDSALAVLESKPTDWIHSKLDLYFSYYNENQLLRGMEVPMAIWSSAQLQPGYTVTNGLVSNYTLKNIQPVVRNMVTAWTDHLASGIWQVDAGEKSAWPVHFLGGASTAERSEEVLEEYAGLGFNAGATDADTFKVTETAGQLPMVVSSTDYSNASLFTLTDPQGWGVGVFPVTGMEGYLKYFKEKDVADSAKVSTSHELNASIFKNVEVGVSYSERFKQSGQNPTGYLVNANGKPSAPLPPLLGTTDLSFIGNLHPIAYDPNAAYNGGAYVFMPNPNPGSWEGDNFKVWEKVTRPYFQFNLKGDAGVPFEGNIGAQASFADQHSTGFSGNGGNIVYPVSGGATYASFLPSMNLIFKLTKQDDIRLFVGRQEQRPLMYEMRAARDYGYNAANASSTTVSPWSGTSGNPGLRPWLANSVDLDYEHYFAHGGGYFALALFEKQLQNYVYQQNTVTDFSGYPYTSATPPVLRQGITSEYVNGQGGNVSGVEATVQVTSDVLSGGTVKGFGVILNGLVVDSTIQPWGPGNGSAPLPDMSKKTGNATLYYESHGFSARVNLHYQSEAREYIVQFGAPNFAGLGSPNDGYSVETAFHTVDAQVSYAFKDGALKGLTLYLDGRNLNNAPVITYNNGDSRQLTNWQKYGANFEAGVSYKY